MPHNRYIICLINRLRRFRLRPKKKNWITFFLN